MVRRDMDQDFRGWPSKRTIRRQALNVSNNLNKRTVHLV